MENKEIFKTKFEYTWEEYKKGQMYNHSLYWNNVLFISIIEILIILFATILFDYGKFALILCFFVFVINLVVYKVRFETVIKKSYNVQKKKNLLSKYATTFFYENYLIRKNDMLEIKLNYKDIKKIIETDTNFYIFSNFGSIMAISKSDLNENNEEFIRNINKDKLKIKSEIKELDNKKSLFLKGLFILTIFVVFISVETVNIVCKNIPNSFITEKMYIFLLWLPIPLLSIILGFIYKKKSNVVVGIVVSLYLFMFGIFNLVLPIGVIEYGEIKKYEEFLNIEFPKTGKYIQNKYEIYTDNDMKDYIITEAYFDDEYDQKNFELNIFNENRWMKFSLDVVDKYDDLIPEHMHYEIDNDNYIIIYNKNTKEYNTEIEKNIDLENNEMLVALYYCDENYLEMIEYKFK